MIRSATLALAIVVAAQAASAQQSGTLSNTTPGVASGTTGTTYGLPGAQQTPNTPGGTVPMNAGTQDASSPPAGLRNYNNSSGLPSPRR
jgi:hypothetical protein